MTRSFVLAAALAALVAQPAMAAGKPSFRLPLTAVPKAYHVHLSPDLASKRFSGTETVEVTVPKPTRTLVLNALELAVSKPMLDGRAVEPTIAPGPQTITLTFASPIPAGRHTLGLSFAGKLGEEPRGLYVQNYQAGGKPASMLVTQFEPTDARRMFPLWDEPADRATFELSLDVPQAFMAVSNMPIAKEQPLATGLKCVDFKPTPPMASYLMVLVAGDLESIGRRVGDVDVRVVTTRGKKQTGQVALDAVSRILPFYNDYFGVKYPLPKLDLIAVPGGDPGAMENWGGIIFDDGSLLFDPRISSEGDRQSVFEFIAHEVAHQWFGNLVTMAWWDDLWLNEGFANWMESKCTAHFNPTWPEWLDVLSKRDAALRMDALQTTHPVQQPIEDATQADSAFDDITYDKGEGVIRMLENAMGPDAFRDGIRRYMKAHAYGNAHTADLWAALGAGTKLPVARIAPSWITRPGFPLLQASQVGHQVQLTQQRYGLPGSPADAGTWPLPLRYTDGGETRMQLVEGRSASLPLAHPDGVVELNPAGGGFYRVQYDEALLKRLNAANLAEADRIVLLGDYWALVAAGRVPAAEVLGMVTSAQAHATAPVWHTIVDILGESAGLMVGSADEAAVDGAIAKNLTPLANDLGWEPRATDRSIDRKLRAATLELLGRVHDRQTVFAARLRFADDMSRLSGDERGTVLAVVGHNANAREFDDLLKQARAADSFEEKLQLYLALADVSDPKLAERVLPLTLPGEVDGPHANWLLRRVAFNHPALVRSYVAAHQADYFAKRTPLDRLGVLSAVYERSNDAASADALQAAAQGLPAETNGDLAKAVERIRVRAAYAGRVRPALTTWTAKR